MELSNFRPQKKVIYTVVFLLFLFLKELFSRVLLLPSSRSRPSTANRQCSPNVRESPKTGPPVNEKYGPPPQLYSRADHTSRNYQELGSITLPSSSSSICQHEHDRLTYPLDGPRNVRLPALRIASIVSSTVNNLVVLIALMCPGVTTAIATAVAAVSSGASKSATPSYSPKQ